MNFRPLLVMIAAIFAGAPSASAGESVPEPECYDALVSALATKQIPSPIPDCDDCIIVSWPWFIDLRIEKVLEGEIQEKQLTVLSVQHTYLRIDRGAHQIGLRRNSTGGFNMVRVGGARRLTLCAEGTPPAKPFLLPGPNRTLNDLRQDGERRYGPGPSAGRKGWRLCENAASQLESREISGGWPEALR